MMDFQNPFRDWYEVGIPGPRTPYLLFEKARTSPLGVISLSAKQMLGESFWMFSASMRFHGGLIGVDDAVSVSQLEQMILPDPVAFIEGQLVRKLANRVAAEIEKRV